MNKSIFLFLGSLLVISSFSQLANAQYFDPATSQSRIDADKGQLADDDESLGSRKLDYQQRKAEYRALKAQNQKYGPQVYQEILALRKKLGSKADDPQTLAKTKDGQRLLKLENWLKQENAAQQYYLSSLKRSKSRLDDAKADKLLDEWNSNTDSSMREADQDAIAAQKSMSSQGSSMMQQMSQNYGSGSAMMRNGMGGYGMGGYGMGGYGMGGYGMGGYGMGGYGMGGMYGY